MTDALKLARIIGACRRVAIAGSRTAAGIRVIDLEILLLVAGGTDAIGDICSATGGSRANTARSLKYLSGRDSVLAGHGGLGQVRVSPFRLLEWRKHPHRRGHQYRLSNEGAALLAPALHITTLPEWT